MESLINYLKTADLMIIVSLNTLFCFCLFKRYKGCFILILFHLMNMEISLGLFKANECFQICNRRRRTAEFKAAVSFAVINIRAAATPTNISCLFILPLTAYLGPRIFTFGVFFCLFF